MSIVTNFGKIERTYHLPFHGGQKTMSVSGRVPPTKKFTCVTNYSICKARKNRKKRINKAYYWKNEDVTHVNIFFGDTFPFPQGTFMQS